MSDADIVDNRSETTLAEAQLKKLRLELDKLEIEVANMRRANGVDTLIRCVPLIAILVTAVGFMFTVYQYRAEQDKNRHERAEQFEKEKHDRDERARQAVEQAQRDFMMPLLQKQHELYLEALSAAATIASTKNMQSRSQVEETFWKLYWGPLVFVESQEVSDKMLDFGKCLENPTNCPNSELRNRSLRLASAMEMSRHKTLNMKPDEFIKNQFVYP